MSTIDLTGDAWERDVIESSERNHQGLAKFSAATLPDPASLPVGQVVSLRVRGSDDVDMLTSDGARWVDQRDVGRFIKNATAANTAVLRKEIANVRAGFSAGARFVFIGDSTTVGVGGAGSANSAVGTRKFAYTTTLARLLSNTLGIPASDASTFTTANLARISVALNTYDSRWVLTNFTTDATLGNGMGCIKSSTAGATAVFTPGTTFNKITVLYAKSTGLGSFTTELDGGGSLGTTTTVAANKSIGSVTYSSLSGTATSYITLTCASASVYIIGVIVENTSTSRIELINYGGGSCVASDYTLSTEGYHAGYAAAALAGKVAFIQMSINDMKNVAQTVGQYVIDMTALVDNYKSAGYECYLITQIPSSEAFSAVTTIQRQDEFADAVRSVASATNVAFFDLYKFFGTYTEMNSLGYYADTLHGNGKLYGEEAEFFANCIKYICDTL